ncbi:glycosyltransferase family 4 protein [Egicoccus halophilus]|uniref:Glycosyl transferase n=1 Tax=Egicoccus halophilus TaxID=1670830 RepID=A0A8J3ERP5_9ACTN|nr:glycosyltransferase family 4 protein [Egicoccus halophilus]GGI05410.1 glycosyl transferase [Egicoccus halophilus]
MRILQLHTRYRQAGGEDRVVEAEAELLRAAGHEVLLHEEANAEGAGAAIALGAAMWNPAAARRAAAVAEAFAPDVVHVHNTWFSMSPAVLPALRARGLPVVMTLHNYRLTCAAATLFRDGAPCEDCVGSHPWHGVRHRCYRDSAPSSAVAAGTIAFHARRGTWQHDVDRYLALSDFGRDRFVAAGLPADRLDVKPNSVADPGPRPRPPSSSDTVVFVGRLSPEKGLDVLLDAWRRAAPRLRLVVVGTGPMDDDLRSRRLDGVEFRGRLAGEAVEELLRSSRALVFPSTWYEGHPLVPLEAAAAGLPVLLSDLGAMTSLFAPGDEELRFPPGDAQALAERLRWLEDADVVDRAGRFVRARYEQRYTHEQAVATLEATYRQVRAPVG